MHRIDRKAGCGGAEGNAAERDLRLRRPNPARANKARKAVSRQVFLNGSSERRGTATAANACVVVRAPDFVCSRSMGKQEGARCCGDDLGGAAPPGPLRARRARERESTPSGSQCAGRRKPRVRSVAGAARRPDEKSCHMSPWRHIADPHGSSPSRVHKNAQRPRGPRPGR